MKTPNQEFIEGFDSSCYDVEAMLVDNRHGNFSPQSVEDYRHENIVRQSIVNGQWSQARRQCAAYGLNYEDQRLSVNA